MGPRLSILCYLMNLGPTLSVAWIDVRCFGKFNDFGHVCHIF